MREYKPYSPAFYNLEGEIRKNPKIILPDEKVLKTRLNNQEIYLLGILLTTVTKYFPIKKIPMRDCLKRNGI